VTSAVLCTWVAQVAGDDVVHWLQESPATETGLLFIGWLVAGPPYVLLVISWFDRHRLSARSRHDRAHVLGVWAGASMLLLPARFTGVGDAFPSGALAGYPLLAGWSWAALANVIAIGFGLLMLFVLRRSVHGPPTPEQRELTLRFLERAWLILLAVSLAFALYGETAGLFSTGT
jgi:hypothetical protein